MSLGTRIPCLALVLASTALAGCGTHRTSHVLAPLAACVNQAGGNAVDVSASRDLQVSDGELAIRFADFDAYVGLARGRGEARDAARALDRDLLLFQQAGRAYVRRSAVYYVDAPVVPEAASRFVAACLDGSDAAALDALDALSLALPRVQLPAAVRARFLARCRGVLCACAYARAARLYPPDRVAHLGTLAFAALRRVCSADQEAVRTGRQRSGTNQRNAPSVPPTARIVVGATA